MGCGCGAKATVTANQTIDTTKQVHMFSDNGECVYTIEQVDSWLTKVYCVKNNAYYSQLEVSELQINLYIGILISTQNYVKNGGSVCYYKNELEEIEAFIFNVQNKGLCQ